MGLFNNLMSKIFGHAAPSGSGSSAAPAATAPGSAPASAAPAATLAAPVDIEAVLNGLAAKNPEKLDWKHSIVDLMKLVGMDSSFAARKELAKDLDYTGDMNDSASMNIWLQKQVMLKLSQNGDKVPAELLK